ncbi:MAG: site-2 protease family protein [Clostridia bacterium]|nr:site-2 protease family protein [Clostridia bacterium]
MLDFFNNLPIMLLSLPAILLSLSIHEAAHGYIANKLGDPTARNLGRLTLNPLKHINLFGFISMLLFRVGWANPVPINTRNFKNPRRDMAISAAAGPISNLCLATIFTILLRLTLIAINSISEGSLVILGNRYWIDESLQQNALFTILSLLAIIFFLGISLNINLMFFNLIPLPPLDGSRIAYIFLPTETYFKIMEYERYIMIGFLVVFASGILDKPLLFLNGLMTDLLYKATGMPEDLLGVVLNELLNRLPQFTL